MTDKYKNELMLVHNEILGDMKNMENKLEEKIRVTIQFLEEQKIIVDKKLSYLEKNYNSFIQRIESQEPNDNSKEKELLSKIQLLNRKIEDNNYSLEIKFSDLKKELKDISYKYELAISDNFLIPGIVGQKSPFVNIKELLENMYKNMNELLKTKEQQSLDIKKYKEKIDNVIFMYKKQINILETKLTSIFEIKIKDLEKKYNERIDIIEERINLMRIENGKYSYDLINKSNELDDKCNKVDDMLKKYYDEQNEKFDKYKETFKEMNDKLNNYDDNYKLYAAQMNTINDELKKFNKINLENKIKEIEKNIITLKSLYSEQKKYFSPEINDIGKSMLLNNNKHFKKIDILKYQNNDIQLSDQNEDNTKITKILYDSDFFKPNEYLSNLSFSHNSNHSNNFPDKIKKAKIPIYRIKSGKIFNKFPFIVYDNNRYEDKNKEDEENNVFCIDEYIKDLKKRRNEKEYKTKKKLEYNHNYKYLDKKIDILGKTLAESYNKIIYQIMELKGKKIINKIENNKKLKEKEKEESEDNIIIHSIKNNNFKNQLSSKKYSSSFIPNTSNKYKKVNLLKSKIYYKMKTSNKENNS